MAVTRQWWGRRRCWTADGDGGDVGDGGGGDCDGSDGDCDGSYGDGGDVDAVVTVMEMMVTMGEMAFGSIMTVVFGFYC